VALIVSDITNRASTAAHRAAGRVAAVVSGVGFTLGAVVADDGDPLRVAQLAIGGALIFAACLAPHLRARQQQSDQLAPVVTLPRPARPVDSAADAADELEWWLELLREAAYEHGQLPTEVRRRIEANPGPHEKVLASKAMVHVSTGTRQQCERAISTAVLVLREASATTRPVAVGEPAALALVRPASTAP